MTASIGNGLRQVVRVVVGALRSDIVFCWFASVYAAVGMIVAGLFGKKSVVVIGGVDMAKEPEFGYGLWLSPWKAALVRTAIKSATKVLVVDESLKNEVLERVKYRGNNIEILPTGYDPDFWQPGGVKDPTVLTVAAVQSVGRMRIKGIDILFEVARRLPRFQFVLVGFSRGKFPSFDLPVNVECVDPLDRSALLPYYQRARIYCQPSRREGLSNTLCEAMLCACIPVATNVGGTAQAVGTHGIVVRPDDPEGLALGIEQAFAMTGETGLKARERVVALFPKANREKRLVALINQMGP